ncbi:MAG: tyrosine-type recombinase/integrase [Lachnospiraceae bacterium]|jgi:integrase/recombinase XerC|nr:tyrosine-type recombinase/integrase [Lachnospiraceae bacterium]
MSDYKKQEKLKLEQKTSAILDGCPSYVRDYFNNIKLTTEPLTRYNYAVDIMNFLQFIVDSNSSLNTVRDITPEIFNSIRRADIIEYLGSVAAYVDKNGIERTNSEHGYARKLSALRSLYKFLVASAEYPEIRLNPAAVVRMPKIHKKDIIYMEKDEISDFLDLVKSGNLSGKKKQYYEKTKYRDIAIMTLFLGTGMRVSELVGINIDDIDLDHNSVQVSRKGGKVQFLYFNNDVKAALQDYLDIERPAIAEKAEDRSPLFYSMQKKRIGTKAVENLVKKYAAEAVPNKHITAHKLRSTYATNLYENTDDIYLVSSSLGHESLETTKHYADESEERRRRAKDYTDWL